MSELPVIQEYRALEARILDAMDTAISDDSFSGIALAVFQFQCRWNETYRAFARSAPAPRSWREIPAVPQAAFKRSRLSCVPLDLAVTLFRTSGTTGETRGEHLFLDTRLCDAAIVRGWDWLAPRSLPLRIIARPSEDAPDSSLSHMLGVLARERSAGRTQWFVDRDGKLDIDGFQESIADGQPVGAFSICSKDSMRNDASRCLMVHLPWRQAGTKDRAGN
jgi:hypothetical protein